MENPLRLILQTSHKSRKIAPVFVLIFCICLGACSQASDGNNHNAGILIPGHTEIARHEPLPAIYLIDSLADVLLGKRVGVVANHTSKIGNTHLIDTLMGKGVNIVRIFGPEHGFRGDQADGAYIENTIDAKTGVPVVSLYGKLKKPRPEHLNDLDCVIFDIQDVGARFYTYLSTLHYVMESCAENSVSVVVLDRPNPNAHYVDGPVLKEAFSSFVGLHPVPVVYGMTIGEYALMINGEGWLKNGTRCELSVVPNRHYTHNTPYILPIHPSPNLTDMQAIMLYPSLCFFEGTTVSVGRGTDFPFKVIGEPNNGSGDFTFTPGPKKGASTSPPHNGKLCRGYDLQNIEVKNDGIDLGWLIRMYHETESPNTFFLKSGFFEKLAGTDKLRLDIQAGKTENEIKASWQDDLHRFKEIRSKYLIYE